MDLTKRFHKACADYGLLEDGDHVLIGLSGGKDSLALTELLGKRAQIYKPRFRVTALHVRVKERDYQTDLSYLEQFCQDAKVPLIVRDTEIGEAPPNAKVNATSANTAICLNTSTDDKKRAAKHRADVKKLHHKCLRIFPGTPTGLAKEV